MSVEEVYELTAIDPWFLAQLEELLVAEREFSALADVDAGAMRRMQLAARASVSS